MRHVDILHNSFWNVYDAALTTVLERAHKGSTLSNALGIDRSLVTMWQQRKRLPTLEQAVAMEMQFRVSRKALRPDIDWTYIDERRLKKDLQLDPAKRVKEEMWEI